MPILIKLDETFIQMKKRQLYPSLTFWVLLLLAINVAISCKQRPTHLSVPDSARVKDSVSRMAANMARDISKKGPAAWLDYFENTPGFFMASQGELVFTDYQSAQRFILNTLDKEISKISLRWNNLRVDPLASDLAFIGADFHEDLSNISGKIISIDGYFTAMASLSNNRWKLRNLHWSIKAPINPVTK
jgi:hypothetical protein